jgi:hypothetical protein
MLNMDDWEGLDWVAEGLVAADQNGIRVAEAELHRLKGELLLIREPGAATMRLVRC